MRVANVRYVAIVFRLGSGAIVPISSGCIGFATVSSIVVQMPVTRKLLGPAIAGTPASSVARPRRPSD